MSNIPASELLLNKDGSLYHINLLPDEIADTIITVGDPDRVGEVSRYFDSIEVKKQKREFVTHTGYLGKKRISVISTGISTDNIDIVLNELDALVNIDLKQRTIKPTLKSLQIIRVGTAGGLQPDIPIDSFVVTSHAIGLDGLAPYYEFPFTHNSTAQALHHTFLEYYSDVPIIKNSYVASSDASLLKLLSAGHLQGITVTCGGFYGPQGRILRARPRIPEFIGRMQKFSWQQKNITNFEMETAGLYALGELLGHHCCSTSAVIANRITGQSSANITKAVDKLIQHVLGKISANISTEKTIPLAAASQIA